MSSIVWFEVPADNVERAKNFYGGLFGWKIEKMPGAADYWHLPFDYLARHVIES